MRERNFELPDFLTLADRPPPSRRVFVNRNLRMDQIRAIGFDMDYTIARYRRRPIEELAYRLTIDKLVARGYSESIRSLVYDGSFVIRGLTVDKQLGNIIKVDRHNHVGRAFHGRTPVDKDKRRDLYRRERLHFGPPRFATVDTLFSLPEACLYADIVDHCEQSGGVLDTWKLYDDIRECIDKAHADGSIKRVVMGNIAEFIEHDPELARTLHKLRSSGKKLFLLTNSGWDYTHALMSFLFSGDMPEYADWLSCFELVIVSAHKPAFFTGAEPFVEIDREGQPLGGPVENIVDGHVYRGGNLKELERSLGVMGEEILYVGDHIYGDILRSKKASMWRTALVIEELEDELDRTLAHEGELARLIELESRRRSLDDLANVQRQNLSAIEKALGSDQARVNPEFDRLRRDRDQTKKLLKDVIADIEERETRLDQAFHPRWGMVFKESGENSRFGEQVTDYACIYTSRVTNFSGYSSHQYFRSPRDLMPHERL